MRHLIILAALAVVFVAAWHFWPRPNAERGWRGDPWAPLADTVVSGPNACIGWQCALTGDEIQRMRDGKLSFADAKLMARGRPWFPDPAILSGKNNMRPGPGG